MPNGAPPSTRMLPALDDDNRAFWTGGADGALRIPFCTGCNVWVSPLAAECPDCNGALEARPVSGRGTVFTYTVNHQQFNPAVPVPYVIAIVELDEQADLRIAANIVDCEPDSVRIGLPVEVRFERQNVGDESVYVPVFAPAD
ncbi:OB-fold domain-containing protein [Mycobacterium barrassiae]|nr:OB-fold domain-containing protein [Mycobacterium barrassiae]